MLPPWLDFKETDIDSAICFSHCVTRRGGTSRGWWSLRDMLLLASCGDLVLVQKYPVCNELQLQQAMWDYRCRHHLSPVWLATSERILAISQRSLYLLSFLTSDTWQKTLKSKILCSSQMDVIKKTDFLTMPFWSICWLFGHQINSESRSHIFLHTKSLNVCVTFSSNHNEMCYWYISWVWH